MAGNELLALDSGVRIQYPGTVITTATDQGDLCERFGFVSPFSTCLPHFLLARGAPGIWAWVVRVISSEEAYHLIGTKALHDVPTNKRRLLLAMLSAVHCFFAEIHIS